MGSMDWAGRWFSCNGQWHYTSVFPPMSKYKMIMSKYKPIAPKPSSVTSVRCESLCNSKSDKALKPRLKVTSRKQRNGYERSNRKRRLASDFCNSPSPRVRRREEKAPCIADCLGSVRNPVVETVQTRIIGDRAKIEHHLDKCFSVDKLSVVKDLCFMERESRSFRNRSVCDRETCVFGEKFKLNGVIDSVGEIVIQSPSECMEVRLIQAMGRDPDCGLGFAKCLVLPSDIQKHKEEEKTWRNQVTLPLLPETSPSKDSDVGSCAPDTTSNSAASYDKEKFRVRIFGKDFSN